MRKSWLLIAVLVLIVLTVVTVRQLHPQKKKGIRLKYASGPAVIEAPAHAAFDKGYFKKEGLNLELVIAPDGKTALSQLFAGNVDLAGVMATPVVYESFKRKDFRIVAMVEHPKFHHLLVDSSLVAVPSDLAGKNIGVTRGTSGEFFMYSFLVAHEVSPESLNIYNLKGSEMVDSFASGRIDAMFSWDPYISEAQKATNRPATLINTSKLVPPSWIIVGKKRFVERNSPAVNRFLRAVKQGVAQANEKPEEFIAAHARLTGKNKDYVKPSAIKGHFQLTLQQELLLDLEMQARWLIGKNDSLNEKMPNYLDLIDPRPMREVSPQTVTLIK